jgi:hypothetical protein
MAGSSEVDRLRERVAFYESFDDLIQQSIGRANLMIREAAERREEATTTILEVRQSQAQEREGQRAVLAELLDDVMTIQQATERLAHRVSEALEQVEFMIEPTGLPATDRLGSGAGLGELGTGSNALRTDAENVRDEVSAGAFAPSVSAPSTGALPSFHDSSASAANHAPEPDTAPVSGTPTETSNPETAESDPVVPMTDSPQSLSDVAEQTATSEPSPGSGSEAARVESNAQTWISSDAAPRGGQAGTEGGSRAAETGTGNSTDIVLGEAPASDTVDQGVADDNAETPQADSGTQHGSDPSMTEDEPTSVSAEADTPGTEQTGIQTATNGNPPNASRLPNANTVSQDELRVVATTTATRNSSTAADSATEGTAASAATAPRTIMGAVPRSAPSQDTDAHTSSQSGLHVVSSEETAVGAAPTAPVAEQRTTLIMNGVPRAAVALSIQRHILSRPEVLRAEVREYYDHRLTLSVTSERQTTVEDLADWDPTASWETVNEGDETLEVRLIM